MSSLMNERVSQHSPSALAESPRHQLPALVYRLIAGLEQSPKFSQRNCAVRFRRAQAASAEPAMPCLAKLLADPAFQPLEQWLCQAAAAGPAP